MYLSILRASVGDFEMRQAIALPVVLWASRAACSFNAKLGRFQASGIGGKIPDVVL